MFGQSPRLAIDTFLGLKGQHVSGSSPSEYMQKLEDWLTNAYKQTIDAAVKSGLRGKRYYDQKVKECKHLIGDRVLVRNVGLNWKQKLANIVQGQPNPEMPVFAVKREDGQGKLRVLHRNMLLLFMSLPTTIVENSEKNSSDTQANIGAPNRLSECNIDSSSSSDMSTAQSSGATARYVPSHRRRSDQPVRPQRGTRQGKSPGWMTSGDFI